MSCDEEARRTANMVGKAAGVARASGNCANRCVRDDCDAFINRTTGYCLEGHAQSEAHLAGEQAEVRINQTEAGKKGMTSRPWRITRKLKWMPPEDAALISPRSLVQPMPQEGVECEVCGRRCRAQAFAVEDTKQGRMIVAGPECARNLLGNINFQEVLVQAREEERAAYDAALAAQEDLEIATAYLAWKEESPALWQFLQAALEQDPENDFFQSLDSRLRHRGGLTPGQMGALQKAATKGLEEVTRRRVLRESDVAYGQAMMFARFCLRMGQYPGARIIEDMLDRRSDGFGYGRTTYPLTPKQRAVVQRALKRFANTQFYPRIVQDRDWAGDEGATLFWATAPFVQAILQAENLSREPTKEEIALHYWVGAMLCRAAHCRHLDTRWPDDVALVDVATGEPVEWEGHQVDRARVGNIYLDRDDGQWYIEFSLDHPTQESWGPDYPRVHVPIDETVQLVVLESPEPPR